jgi:hypothetical protein
MTVTAGRPTMAGRERSRWLIAGGVVTAVALAFTCLYVWDWFARGEETQHQTYHQRVNRIVVDLNMGDLTITAGDTDQVSVDRELTWSIFKPQVEERWDPGTQTLRVWFHCAPTITGKCSVSYMLGVPPDVPVEARTGSGNITVREMRGDLRLSATSGNVDVANSRGTVWAHSTSGNVRVNGARSQSVDARTTSGDVDLRFAEAPGTVSAKATSGNVNVAVPAGTSYFVGAQAQSGEQKVSVGSDPRAEHKIYAHAGSGHVRVVYS